MDTKLMERTSGAAVVGLIHGYRLPLNGEKELQAAIAEILDENGIGYERERRLGNGDIVDFLLDGGIAIECKMAGVQARAVHRQCVRYCSHEEVRELVIATNKAMGTPHTINGKPIFIASLGLGWF